LPQRPRDTEVFIEKDIIKKCHDFIRGSDSMPLWHIFINAMNKLPTGRTMKLYFIILIFFLSFPGISAKIEKRILKDGSIEYYNISESIQKKNTFSTRFDPLIEKISRNNGIDPFLIKCIIQVESGFNPDAVSVAGAMGLMQLMQDTARYFKVKDPLDPEENLNAGIRHFKSLYNHFNGDIQLALAAYHAGLGRVKNRTLPPIQATVDYVEMVLKLYSGVTGGTGQKIQKLYKRIDSEGDIIILSD
jgi:soluble lytic murein transglycosylase-like protein